jgi:hypothetical protein
VGRGCAKQPVGESDIMKKHRKNPEHTIANSIVPGANSVVPGAKSPKQSGIH